MTTTHTYPPETAEGHKRKTPIFSMDDIPASASKENPELFRSASIRGQPPRRETYSHCSFTARQSNHYSSPSPPPPPPPPPPSVLLHLMTPHTTGGPGYSTDTGRTQTHTLQHLNLHPMGGNQPPRNLKTPEAKLIPPLMLQTDTTVVTKRTIPNQVAQTSPEVPAALMDQGDQAAPVAPATIHPTSRTSCGNS